ncbi:MAG: hypothetical protein IJA69_03090 [Clostridia bacterium]|nr:hypothetical protein [Clostridia bacterium]
MNKQKPRKTLYTILGTIGDIIFIPIMLIAVLVCMVIFMDRRQNEMPQFFGISLVRVMSSSMKASGFYVGDTVLVKNCPGKEIWVGDVIAFYNKYDSVDNSNFVSKKFTKLEQKDQQVEINQNAEYPGRTTMESAKTGLYRVNFHEVKEVYVDESGTRFFVTQGTSNASKDTYPVREEFVVGKYIETPVAFRSVIKWISSPIGMIILVCLPLGILVILQSLSLIEQVNFIVIEKKLLKGEIDYKDEEAQRLIKSGDMEEVAKVIYLGKAPPENHQELYDVLWSTKTLSLEKQRTVQQGYEILGEKGKKAYFEFWIQKTKSKRDLNKLEEQLSIVKLSNASNQPSNEQNNKNE